LYVSVKTVEAHLGHIFAKLGTRFRQDLITGIGAPGRVRTTIRVTPRVRP
jgi:DNA-binding CsgD family transcriptional regulator